MYDKYKSHKIVKKTFTELIWYFYFYLGKEMYDNGIRTFDDVTVYSYLVSRPKEKNKKSWLEYYEENGGYDTIKELIEECNKDKNNDEYHFSEIQKYEVLRKFQQEKLIDVNDKELINKLISMTLKQVQMFFQYKYRNIFLNINAGEVAEYNLIDQLDETIEKLNEGEDLGMDLFESPRLNRKIKGWKDGHLMYVVMSSGTGKSSFGLEKTVLSSIKNNEKTIMFVNEEDVFKTRVLLLATVSSRILNIAVPRDSLSQGNFDKKTLEKLHKAKEWLYSYKRDLIKFCYLKNYRIEDVISRIELYRPLGYSKVYFDTFKPDRSQKSLDRWEAFSNSAQELYDCIKTENNNCATLATVQLKIGRETRYLDLSAIGKSKEIVEVASVVLMGRILFADEYPGNKNELITYNWEWDDLQKKWDKVSYEINPEKIYLILFIAKNRHGSEDEQILYEVNYDFNSWREVSYCIVPKMPNII